MGALGTWLVSLATPAVFGVLKALGFGFVTFAALTAALNVALDAARSSWGGVTGDLLGLLQLAGSGTAFSIIAGAMVARVAILSAKKLQVLA
jgi:cobalamin synthase